MSVRAPYFPIVFVRGFAPTMTEIEDATATPHMGFNLGATKIRQDHTGKIVRFIFESPLLRLIKDEGYIDAYRNGDFIDERERAPSRSVWIYRYYEKASESLGSGERQSIPEIAVGLREFILRIRRQVCGADAEALAAFRVHLVAHSMGGLICRCYLQSLCANGSGDRDRDKTLDLTNRPRDANGCVDASVHLVDKVFTYASPHNGIDIAGVNAPDLGPFDRLHVRNFNREVMHDFLALPGKYKDGARVDSLAGTFPAERFFCMIGTNYADYKAFWGLSSKSAGPMSDGLVAIANAAVAGAPRAFAHRSHGGHFGIVNSEEGYQNLRRFLFGQVRVDARLFADELTLRESIQKLKDGGKKIRASYNIECAAQVRGGASWHLHERRVLQASAILGDYDVMVKRGKPVFLFTGYLLESARSPNVEGKDLAFSIHLAVRVPVYEVENKFWFDDHFEGETLFERTVVFHVRRRAGSTSVGYELMPQHVVASDEEPLAPTDLGGGRLRFEIPLGFREGVADPPRPGFRGRLELIAQPWNA